MLFRHQHFVHQRRIAKEDEALVEKGEPRRIAAGPLQVLEKIQRPAKTPVHASHKRYFPRTWDGMKRAL